MKVTVIIPTLNEEQSLGQTIDQIPKDFANLEILIVDGLSKDKTVEIAENKSCRVVMEKRKGYGRAYKTGFAEARGDIICTLDGDTTYPAEEFPRLVKMLIDEKLDFITCDRITKMEKGAMTGTHKLGNWALKVGANVLFGLKLKDSQTGMWVFRKEILKKINLVSDGMPLSEEIKIECFRNEDIKAKEVSVPYRPRIGDIKLNTWGDGRKNMMYLFRKRIGKVSPDYEEGDEKKKDEDEKKKDDAEEVVEEIKEEKTDLEVETPPDNEGSDLRVELEGEEEVETDENASVTLEVKGDDHEESHDSSNPQDGTLEDSESSDPQDGILEENPPEEETKDEDVSEEEVKDED